jgi:hypothetical protein
VFRVILWSQWKWSRLAIVLGTVAAFAVPVFSVQGAARPSVGPLRPNDLLHALQAWGIVYPLLAATLGLLVAIGAWAPDHRGRHVHALTLPIPRWRYGLLRFTAGAAVLAVPVVAAQLGALLAVWTATIPTGLQAYPFALGLRFGLSVLVAYAVFFAIAGGTARTAGAVLGSLALLVVLQLVGSAAGLHLDLFEWTQRILFDWPGPFAIFAGRWMLIDV